MNKKVKLTRKTFKAYLLSFTIGQVLYIGAVCLMMFIVIAIGVGVIGQRIIPDSYSIIWNFGEFEQVKNVVIFFFAVFGMVYAFIMPLTRFFTNKGVIKAFGVEVSQKKFENRFRSRMKKKKVNKR